jgi:hypothetical protein
VKSGLCKAIQWRTTKSMKSIDWHHFEHYNCCHHMLNGKEQLEHIHPH